MTQNAEIVRAFIESWSTLDVDRIVSFFAEDGVYHNMPIDPVQGHEALKVFIGAFLADWTATDWDIITLIAQGDTVFAERLDRIRVGATDVSLPCCGVFEIRDGKIATWRDYFDMTTYSRALSS